MDKSFEKLGLLLKTKQLRDLVTGENKINWREFMKQTPVTVNLANGGSHEIHSDDTKEKS